MSSISDQNKDVIPELRRDLQLIPVSDNGHELLYFHDSLGYATPNFALHSAVKPLLSLFTGEYQISDFLKRNGSFLNEKELKDFIKLLDDACLLLTSKYHQKASNIESNFEKMTVREPVLTGNGYPGNPGQFHAFMDELFLQSKSNIIKKAHANFRALYAPHIDIRVGKNEYSESFSKLRKIKPSKVLLLGTSHYAGYYNSFYENHPFIGSIKDFKVPGKLFKTDKKILERLNHNSGKNGFTLSDRAHRVEHSIETHLAFVSAIWNHDFEIIPILVGSLDELFYHKTGNLSKVTEQFADDLREILQDQENIFTLISGDLSHVGKKFGDSDAAVKLRESVTIRDRKFLEYAINGSPDKLLELLADDFDSTRICGFPPLYIYLKTMEKSRGKLIHYQWWDESERESAVSFGSILY